MIVALTGAHGLIGVKATAALEAAGHEVRRLTRFPVGKKERRFVLAEPLAPDALTGVDALIHNAHDFTVHGWEEVERVNVAGSFALLDAAKAAGVSRIVFVSSVTAYEGTPSNYGKGKLLVERRVLDGGGIVVRPGLVHGAAGSMWGALAKLSRLPVLPVPGAKRPLRLVHVEEVARDLAASLTWDPKTAGGPVPLAHPDPVPFGSLLRAIGAARGRAPLVIPVPALLAYAPLRLLEALDLPLRFRADSLDSLLQPNPAFDWSSHARLGLRYEPFALK